MEIINVSDEIIEINVTEEVINIVTQTGAYPLPSNVFSVFGRTGNVVGVAGDYTTSLVTEGTNLYYTNARSRAAISETITGINYDSASGIFSMASGYAIATTASQSTWDAAYNDKINSAAVTGTTTKVLTLNQQDGGTITASWTDDNTDAVSSVFGRTGAVVATEGDYTLTQLGDVTLTSPASGQVLKYNGTAWVNGTDTDTGLTSVGLSMPAAFSVSGSPLTSNGTISVTGSGVASQYVRGDGSLANFPTSSGGGSSVAYYFNSSVSQGTLGGVAYRELSKVPIIGAGTDVTIAANGYIASYITDANDPALLEIPAGNWNFEMYFSSSSSGGSPSFYVELYKYNGTTFTLISSSSAAPEVITNGTAIDLYTTALAVPSTILTLTDRLAIRVYVTHSGRTITLHTENSHLCEVITTFSSGINALNGLTNQVQYLATGTSGTDFNISSATDTHTFNLPTASGSNTGKLSSSDWTTFNNKQPLITAGTTAQYYRGDKTFQTLDTLAVPENTNLYYTDARARAAITGTLPISVTSGVVSISQAGGASNGYLSSTDFTTFNNKQAALNGTGFVKISGTTISYDNNTYLTTISGIAAGGELSGTYANPTLVNSAVTGKVLTGLNLVGGGTIADTDSILGAFGKVQNQISALVGGVMYEGTWNASTNTPTITSSVGSKGDYYVVATAGSTNINGITDWKIGDWIIFNGSTWDKVDNTDAVSSVNGYTGAVSLVTSDVPESTNLYFTNARAIGSTLTGYTSGSGVVAATDTILQAIQKLNGNIGGLVTGVSSVFGRTGAVVATSGDYNTSQVTENTNLYYTEGRVSANTDVAANTAARHAAVTIGTANGLSLSTQALSLAAASTSTTGALTSTDWNTFNGKQAALNGTGFVKISGTTISYDNSTYLTTSSASSTYLPLAGGTLTGALSGTSATFSGLVEIGNTSGSSINSASGLGNLVVGNGGASSQGITIYTAPTTYGGLNFADATSGGGAYAGYIKFDHSNDSMGFFIGNTQRLSIASTGAATFSSSATFGSDVFTYNNGGIFFSGGATYTSGIFQQSGGTLALQTGSTPRLQITSGGNVGIGTSSPTEKLDVIGGGLAAGNGTIRTGITYGSFGLIGTFTNHDLGIITNGTERMRIGVGGTNRYNVAIGTTSFYNQADNRSTLSLGGGTSGSIITFGANSVDSGYIIHNGTDMYMVNQKNGSMSLYTNDQPRMTITNTGQTQVTCPTSSIAALAVRNSAASVPAGQDIIFTASPNNTTSAFLFCVDGTEGKFVVWSNGDVDSRTNSYGGWSDIKLKENITDATPKLQDLLKVKIKNYNFIGDDKKQIGVVAQELEEIFPNLVSESADFETDKETGEKINLGTTTKSVKYSVFVPMLIKAIQEQQAQIEELKALIAAK